MCAGLALAAAQAGIVEETHSKPVLAASVEVAPFAEIRQRLQTLGTLVNNPIVPMALVPAIQSAIQEEMGSFRPDSAITVRTYVYQPAWQIAATSTVEYAAEDLMKTEVAYADPAKATRPLVRAELTATGLNALEDFLSQTAAEEKRARKAMGDEISGFDLFCRLLDESNDPSGEIDLRAYSRARFAFDLDGNGLSFDFALEPGPGVKLLPAAGFRLPAGALDGVPDNALCVLAFNDMLWGMCGDEKTWKASLESSVRFWDGLVNHLVKKPDGQKYAPFLKDMSSAIAACLRESSFPDPADWSVSAFALGPRREPYVVLDGVSAAARKGDAIDARLLDAVAAAVEKQWPGRGLVRASNGRMIVDYAAVLDVAAAEAILGATKGDIAVLPQAGKAHSAYIGPVGVRRPVSQKPTGEARLAAALPETVADRPSCFGMISCYAIMREFVLPAAVGFVPKKNQDLYRTVVQSMPHAGVDSALACAYWARPDGAHRFLLRVTAEELKNYGAMYNVFSAMQLSSEGRRGK